MIRHYRITEFDRKAKRITAEEIEPPPIVSPPATFTVDFEGRKAVLYTPDGNALVKRPVGFRVE